MAITPEVFRALKQASEKQIEIMRDILKSVGLDTSAGELPKETPCFLFTKSKVAILNG